MIKSINIELKNLMHGMTFSNLTKTKRFGNAEKN